jgi:hypothetical protein
MQGPENPNPEIHQPLDLAQLKAERDRARGPDERDPIDALEVYEMVRNINDPEHPLTLEQLKVVGPGAAAVVAARFSSSLPLARSDCGG